MSDATCLMISTLMTDLSNTYRIEITDAKFLSKTSEVLKSGAITASPIEIMRPPYV